MTVALDRYPGSEDDFSHETLGPPIVDFESYRLLCDTIDEFRKVGIQDVEAFDAAIRDEGTVFVEFGGLKLPMLAPLRHEKMYNEERCLEMSGKTKAMLLAIPLEILNGMHLEDPLKIDDDTIVIVEEFVPADKSSGMDEHDVASLPFSGVAAFDFKNPALADKPQNETAWMAGYKFQIEPKEGVSRAYDGEPMADEIMKKWRERCAEKQQPEFPGENATGTFLLSADQLAQHPEIVAQLWEISQIGFGKILGESHPVSMEFNQDFFLKQIASRNAITAVHYVDGVVECFGFKGLDMRSNDWINEDSTVMQKLEEEASAKQSAVAHFHELIGRGKRGMGYATKILSTVFDTVARTGCSFSVFFESTNLSSTYIPPMIVRELSRSEVMTMTSDIKTVGKLTYWGLVSDDASKEV